MNAISQEFAISGNIATIFACLHARVKKTNEAKNAILSNPY